VYVHGWKDSATSENSQLLAAALSTASANVILVDWSGMAAIESPFQPSKAVTATQQVGETVADFLIKTGLPVASLTLIGHSLGSLVASSAAGEIKIRTGQTISELVALDTAFGNGYDIDARTKDIQAPLTFDTGLAATTTSFTVSDLIGGIPVLAGDNERAATADKAYLVQYARSRDLPLFRSLNALDNAIQHATGLHNGVIGVFADLFQKQALDPGRIPVRQTFNSSGKPDVDGDFDGVVVAPLPWSGNAATLRAPKAIGWSSGYDNPMIYGSNADDVLFFDLFRDERDSAFLFGRGGNDWLIADQTDSQGVDFLTGGRGGDQFWFGYQRYGQKTLPYLNTDATESGYVDNAYAVITDFDLKADALQFGWKPSQIKAREGSSISRELVSLYGDGTAFLRRNDLIAYVPGLNIDTLSGLQAGGRLGYQQFAPLDEVLFFSPGSP
jgi:pimeloyl-ACP methyl ester carboxylesterase